MAMVNFQDGMDFGVGIDGLQLKVRGTGVTGDSPAEVSGGGGQTVQFSLTKVETYEDYQNAFTANADVSAIYGLFHGSAQFNFAESVKFHSYSKYLVASVIVTNAFRQMHQVQLTPSAADLRRNGQQDRFREEFGDSFVLGIKAGGAYYAVLEFTSESEQDLESISAALDVGEFVAFDASAQFTSVMQQFKGHTKLRVTSFQQGGTDTSQTINADQIIDKAENFPAQVKQSAEPYLAFLQDYAAVDQAAGPNFVDIENAKLVMQQFFALRNQWVQKLNDIQYILQNPDQFINPDQNALSTAQQQLSAALNQITQNASRCANKVMDCSFAAPAIPSITLPQRKAGATSTSHVDPLHPPAQVDHGQFGQLLGG